MASHPIDILVREMARLGADSGGNDVLNLTAAFINLTTTHGTVVGDVPPERIGDLWTLAVCHRIALSLKQAYVSRDPSAAVWRRFVTAWERVHLGRDYFEDHPRSFPPESAGRLS